MPEITANEINLYNCFIDEVAGADEMIARKISTEYQQALQAAAEADLAETMNC